MSGTATAPAPRVSVLHQAEYRPMAWANGGGTTTEIARAPAAGPRFAWRVSIAAVERAGPFSRFAGCDRIITLLEGRGMALSFGGAAPAVTIAERLHPVPFSGDWDTDCRLLGGPVSDFNVILDRGAARATVTAHRLDNATPRHETVSGHTVLAYLVAGRLAARTGDAPATTLASGETLRWDRRPGPGELAMIAAGDGTAELLLVDIADAAP